MFARPKRAVRRYLMTRASYKFFIRDWVQPGDAQRSADVMATLRHVRILEPVVLDGPDARRITVIAPHPDDEIIGPGGTLLSLLDRGAEVSVIYLTDGETPPGASASVRDEAEQVARTLGYRTRFLGHSPGQVPLDGATVQAFARAVTETEPEVLFLPFLLDDHDDHRRASHLLLAAAEGGHMRNKIDVWAYQVYTTLPGNVVVDITDQAERKAEAVRLYASQMAKRDWAHFALGLNAFNLRLLPASARATYAEAFFVLPISEYVELCRGYFAEDATACYLSPGYRAQQSGDR